MLKSRKIAQVAVCILYCSTPVLVPSFEHELNSGTELSKQWLSAAQKTLATSEYKITRQKVSRLPNLIDAWHAPNRENNLRTYFLNDGIVVIPRELPEHFADSELAKAFDWQWGLSLTAYGKLNNVKTIVRGAPVVTGNRIEYAHEGLREWYINSAAGVEQGFTIEHAPEPGTDQLCLEIKISGDLLGSLDERSQSLEFRSTGGASILKFDKLLSFDASGRSLESKFVLADVEQDQIVRVIVDVADAQYPIIVDPLAAIAQFHISGNEEQQFFGKSIVADLDVNGDGYNDLIVGSGVDPDTLAQPLPNSSISLYLGSESGLSAIPIWTYSNPSLYESFADEILSAGDLNGDGYDDLIFIATLQGSQRFGDTLVFYGNASGFGSTPDWSLPANIGNYIFRLIHIAANLDVNGDNYDDIILGLPGYSNSEQNVGQILVFYGSANGLSTQAGWTLEGNSPFEYLGTSIGSAGDINRDGYDDFAAGVLNQTVIFAGSINGPEEDPIWFEPVEFGTGANSFASGDVNNDGFIDLVFGRAAYVNPRAPNGAETSKGAAFLYLGTANGLSETPAVKLSENALDEAGFGQRNGIQYGVIIDSGHDVNGDDYHDVLVCDYGRENRSDQSHAGTCFLYAGEADGLNSEAIWVEEADAAANFGRSATMASDLNGDGLSDLIIGAPSNHSLGYSNNGRIYFFYGSDDNEANSFNWSNSATQANAEYGFSVSTAGDVNADGFSDVIIGARFFDNGQQDEGKAFLYHGGPDGPSLTPNWTQESDQADAQFGFSVGTAGDVNADGFADVIVGAIKYNNGVANEGAAFVYHGSVQGLEPSSSWISSGNQSDSQFGSVAGTAGDVNNDGFGDVLVTARLHDNGHNDEGRAYVFLGAPAGLDTTPSWQFESNQANSQFGHSGALIGDANADGFSDVIFGAPFHDKGSNNGGRVYIFHGGVSGLSLSPNLTRESGQANSNLGISVGSAGDANGDGFSDVLVGVPNFDSGQTNEGVAYLYPGSATGISPDRAWTGQVDQANARFGQSLGFGGDINADGYGDIVVAAPLYDNDEADEGVVFVYYGSPSFFASEPDLVIEANQAGANFGHRVSTAGDVNGDGFSDLITGSRVYATDSVASGSAFITFGAGSLPSESPDWVVSVPDLFTGVARAIDGAGDVNGDGFPDIITGEFRYTNGETDEGRAQLYYGSASGPSLLPDWTIEGNIENFQLGYGVNSAGDINGDGFDDILITAGRNQETTAVVLLHLGGAAGPQATPHWQTEISTPFGFLRPTVSSAGDVNGDGYSDIIVASQRDEKAAVYHGGPNGLSQNPAWLKEDLTNIGIAVANAGDLNGDGYSDIAVSSLENRGGTTHLFFGSALGITDVPISISDNFDRFFSPSFFYRRFGGMLAPAGDTNGDGYSDVLIADPHIWNGNSSEGAAMLFLGAESIGSYPEPAWRAELNTDSAQFGWRMDTLGDINGDGLADFIVAGEGSNSSSSADLGGVSIFLGSKTIPNTVGDWHREQTLITNSMVAGPGDVNGDGYADVLLAEGEHSLLPNPERRLMLFYGNGPGFSYHPQQLLDDSDQPIPALGKPGDTNQFRLRINAKSQFARTKVKLEWEVKPAHLPFDGTQLASSEQWADTQQLGVVIDELVDNLADDEIYHWRMRLKFDSVSSPLLGSSRWFTSGKTSSGDIRIRVDTDHDGLSDVQENQTCTDMSDVDTDDDGIPDGAEDANLNAIFEVGETDPCNDDTDNDGIQDGTEIGLVAPMIDPDGTGPLHATDLRVFIPDADGGDTVTSPLNADTDGDEVSDGIEDRNSNGKIDDGESDPNNPSSVPANVVHTVPTLPILLLVLLMMIIVAIGGRRCRF